MVYAGPVGITYVYFYPIGWAEVTPDVIPVFKMGLLVPGKNVWGPYWVCIPKAWGVGLFIPS